MRPHCQKVTLSPVEYLTVEHSTLTTFGNTKITANWDFSHTSKQIYRKLQYKENVFEGFQGLSRFPWKIVWYSSTKFGVLKPWTNIPCPSRFNLGFWQTSKQIYRKLQYKEKAFEELQGLSRFPRKMVLYLLTKFGILKYTANILRPRIINLGFWQTSKQIYRKLQYKEKAFEELQGLSRFPRKMVLYLLTKFGILKYTANILRPRIINLGFWQTSKQIYRKLQYRKKVFGEFQDLPGFTRKMIFYSSTKFGILKPWTNIPSPRRFDLGFWQTSKQIYRQLQYKEKVLEEFEGLSGFPRKIILYSLTKFGIIKPSTNIVWLRRFNLGFWQTSKQVYRNLRCRDNVA